MSVFILIVTRLDANISELTVRMAYDRIITPTVRERNLSFHDNSDPDRINVANNLQQKNHTNLFKV
jgi:hypothetical protein